MSERQGREVWFRRKSERKLNSDKCLEEPRLNVYKDIIRQVESLIWDKGMTIFARGFRSFVSPSIVRAKALGLTEKQIDGAIKEGMRKTPPRDFDSSNY